MKLSPVEWCDQYISAEIPTLPAVEDKSPGAERQREYHKLVVNHMYHSCSDGYCLIDNKCSKRFPKPYSGFNFIYKNNYPNYRRRPPLPDNLSEDLTIDRSAYGNTFLRPVKKVRLHEK